MSFFTRHRLGLVASAALLAMGALGSAGLLIHANRASASTAANTAASTPANGPGSASAARPALTVSTVTPQRASWAQGVRANGNLVAWQEASIGSEAQGWRLTEVRVNVGDPVRRGQVLAVFAADLARAELAQVQAAVAEAEATLAEAAANAARSRELQASGALSAQQIQQYLTAERTAQARLEAQRANARGMQLRLAQTQIVAPDDGVISARSATLGAVVPAGQELFRLVRQGRLEWRAEVAATDLAQLRPGMKVRVFPSGAQPVEGTVRRVAPTVDPATRNGQVLVELPVAATNSAGAKAGMFARGEFNVGSAEAQTLPASAVLLRDGFAWVFVVERDNKVRQMKVDTGRRVGDQVEITTALPPGARVVASGGAFLADGDVVRVVEAAGAATTAPGKAAQAQGAR